MLKLSMLSKVLRESWSESQLVMVYDSNKRLVGCADAYPQKWSLSLPQSQSAVSESFIRYYLD